MAIFALFCFDLLPLAHYAFITFIDTPLDLRLRRLSIWLLLLLFARCAATMLIIRALCSRQAPARYCLRLRAHVAHAIYAARL